MIGSVSKQFTAAVIMRLMELGVLGLDDPISQYLTDIPQRWESVTIRQLLTHTGGIPNYATDFMGFDIAQYYTPEELMDKFTEWNLLNFEPETRWEYSNRGYFLLGMIIKQITGQDYYDYLQENILEPQGINNTNACIKNTRDLAKGYRIATLGGEPEKVANVNPSFAYGAGDLCSTAGDLLEWQRALATGRIVSEDSYLMMTSPVELPDGAKTGYGFGLEITEKDKRMVISHAGGIPSGFIALLSYYPDEEYGTVLLTNTMTPAYNPLVSLETTITTELLKTH
jgi:CubicO group peptidase (beta-lactamase class C family)